MRVAYGKHFQWPLLWHHGPASVENVSGVMPNSRDRGSGFYGHASGLSYVLSHQTVLAYSLLVLLGLFDLRLEQPSL